MIVVVAAAASAALKVLQGIPMPIYDDEARQLHLYLPHHGGTTELGNACDVIAAVGKYFI